MAYRIRPMDQDAARVIAEWHYDGIYAFYDLDQDPEDLKELLDPHSWDDSYFAVMNEQGELVGFFCFEQAEDTVSFGLGLRPDLTGKGYGRAFLEAGLAFARERYHPTTFTLSVATFNQRAIKVYRNAEFDDAGTFMNETNGGQYEFLRMARLE